MEDYIDALLMYLSEERSTFVNGEYFTRLQQEETAELLTQEEATPETSSADGLAAPYHERYYLRYGGSNRCAQQDLKGTRAFLQTLGFDGGELRQILTTLGRRQVTRFRPEVVAYNLINCYRRLDVDIRG